jgi:CYTH domain-containing protein
LELDRYHGDHDGLITMEPEFTSEEQMNAFVLPDWAQGAVEVTHDSRYKNRNLALHGLPQ